MKQLNWASILMKLGYEYILSYLSTALYRFEDNQGSRVTFHVEMYRNHTEVVLAIRALES